jgi:hypothetical protein
MLNKKDFNADSAESVFENVNSSDVSLAKSSSLTTTLGPELLFSMLQAKNLDKKNNKDLCKEFGVNEKDFSRSLKLNNFKWDVASKKYVSLEQAKNPTTNNQTQKKSISKMSLTLKNVTLTYEAYTILKFKLGGRTDQGSIDSCISDCIFKSVNKEMQELLTSDFVSIDVASIASKRTLRKKKEM